MRRPFVLLVLLVVAAAAVVAATSPGSTEERGSAQPASFSAAVSTGSSAASSANWGNRSAAASADPSRWGEPDSRQAARSMARRLARLVLLSSAERLGVEPAELRAAVRSVASGQRRAGRPAQADLTALRDRLAGELGRELGTTRQAVLEAARDELAARLTRGTDLGIVRDEGKRLALACFDAPSSCDVAAVRRELRYARLLGR